MITKPVNLRFSFLKTFTSKKIIEPYNDYKTSESRVFVPKNIHFKKDLSKLI